jgi:hypothetical protein
MTTMQRYADWAPTSFDTRGLGLDDQQDWLVFPMVYTEAVASVLERSNWEVLQRELGDVGEVHAFNHWATSFEILLIDPADTSAVAKAEQMIDALADYLVLDEDHFSGLEYEHNALTWAQMSLAERVQILSAQRLCIFAARRDELPNLNDCSVLGS